MRCITRQSACSEGLTTEPYMLPSAARRIATFDVTVRDIPTVQEHGVGCRRSCVSLRKSRDCASRCACPCISLGQTWRQAETGGVCSRETTLIISRGVRRIFGGGVPRGGGGCRDPPKKLTIQFC